MQLPKGIHVRRQGTYHFSAKYTNDDGTVSQKLCKAVDEALAFQADPTTHASDADADREVDHDNERDGASDDA